MTLTRELRTSIAFILAILVALTVFVWGNQRLVHADSLAEDILCWIDTTDGVHPPVPFFNVGDCDGGPVVPPPPQCFDGIDNDHDGKTDWAPAGQGGDPGCDTPTDNDESNDPIVPPPAAQCADGKDNDGDDKVDMADPGCSSPSDNDETDQPAAPACSDGADNDQDSKTDFPADPGCTDANDTDETDSTGGGGGSPQCSDGIDNDNDGGIDFPADPGCSDAQDDNETTDDNGGGSSGGSSHHHHSSGGSSNNGANGEVLGAETGECPMYLTGYIKYGSGNDAGEVAKLQVFLNNFEANALKVSGVYDAATLAAVNAFQSKYASDVLAPWGMKGPSGYVYYTTQKEINTIYCKFQKDFPLTAAQLKEIAHVREIQPSLRAQGITSASTGTQGAAVSAAKPATTPAVGSVVLPTTKTDKNNNATTSTAAAANASSTQGWFGKFIDWLFGK